MYSLFSVRGRGIPSGEPGPDIFKLLQKISAKDLRKAAAGKGVHSRLLIPDRPSAVSADVLQFFFRAEEM